MTGSRIPPWGFFPFVAYEGKSCNTYQQRYGLTIMKILVVPILTFLEIAKRLWNVLILKRYGSPLLSLYLSLSHTHTHILLLVCVCVCVRERERVSVNHSHPSLLCGTHNLNKRTLSHFFFSISPYSPSFSFHLSFNPSVFLILYFFLSLFCAHSHSISHYTRCSLSPKNMYQKRSPSLSHSHTRTQTLSHSRRAHQHCDCESAQNLLSSS